MQSFPSLLFIDNFDSFTYNLVHAFQVLGAKVRVVRHRELTVEQCLDLTPSHIVIGPGPGDPQQAGISLELIRAVSDRTPLLGVCLGHQCLAEAFGGQVGRASKVMHGKLSQVQHDGRGIFRGLPEGFPATRYHSLSIDASSLPSCLEPSATSEEGEIMAIRHRNLPLVGVQFHPESVLCTDGPRLLQNFLNS